VQRLERGKVVAEGRPSEVLWGDAGADFENVLRGTVTGIRDHTATVRLDSGHVLVAPRTGVDKGDAIVLGLRADEALVATATPEGISARNRIPARIVALADRAGSVELEVVLSGGEAGAPPCDLRVHVTEDARDELGLRADMEVTLIVKTRSLEVLTSVTR
jgi:molybdopterin-binding protein